MKNKKLGAIVSGVVILGCLIGGFKSATVIDPGYVGIVYNLNGGVEDEVLEQGLHPVLPWKKVRQYPRSIEQGYLSKDSREGSEGDDSFDIPTSDGKTVNVDLEYSYHFDPEKLPETYSLFRGADGKTIENTFIRGKLKTWSTEVSSKYSIMELYAGDRSKINKEVSDYMEPLFADFGIVLDACNFSRIEPDKDTTEAIKNKIVKQQEIETEKAEVEKAKQTAERTKIDAQAQADADLIKARGQADANREISASITQELIEMKKAEAMNKWEGKVIGDSSVITNLDN